jgi:hypothetical protein
MSILLVFIISVFDNKPAVAKSENDENYSIPRKAAIDEFIVIFSKNIGCTKENLEAINIKLSECKTRMKTAKRICPSLVADSNTKDIMSEEELNLVSSRVASCILFTIGGRKYNHESSDKIWKPKNDS